MGRKAVGLAPEILAAQQWLLHWRSNNPKGLWVQEEFWVLAAELARKHRVAKIARRLRLNTSKLKRFLAPKNDDIPDKWQSALLRSFASSNPKKSFVII